MAQTTLAINHTCGHNTTIPASLGDAEAALRASQTCPACNRAKREAEKQAARNRANTWVNVEYSCGHAMRLPASHVMATEAARLCPACAEEAHRRLIQACRRKVQAVLRAAGFERETSTGTGSSYYERESATGVQRQRIRVSDHEVPYTEERAANSHSWVHGNNLVYGDYDSVEYAEAAAQEVIEEMEES